MSVYIQAQFCTTTWSVNTYSLILKLIMQFLVAFVIFIISISEINCFPSMSENVNDESIIYQLHKRSASQCGEFGDPVSY